MSSKGNWPKRSARSPAWASGIGGPADPISLPRRMANASCRPSASSNASRRRACFCSEASSDVWILRSASSRDIRPYSANTASGSASGTGSNWVSTWSMQR
ncbi:Uncharacterised protein [Mycobacteroides abscessus subsp. abscessus]|nr:Uncharacterised protein [Mycobacteroides abscessus subsp. abscessus]